LVEASICEYARTAIRVMGQHPKASHKTKPSKARCDGFESAVVSPIGRSDREMAVERWGKTELELSIRKKRDS